MKFGKRWRVYIRFYKVGREEESLINPNPFLLWFFNLLFFLFIFFFFSNQLQLQPFLQIIISILSKKISDFFFFCSNNIKKHSTIWEFYKAIVSFYFLIFQTFFFFFVFGFWLIFHVEVITWLYEWWKETNKESFTGRQLLIHNAVPYLNQVVLNEIKRKMKIRKRSSKEVHLYKNKSLLNKF